MNDTLQRLRRDWPDATFLALGQTALWDEPVKAALRLRLDEEWPEARMIAGAHDTDYFAKLSGHPDAARQDFALVGHDDAATRGLWSAAGEMSQLFGSEDVATRAKLRREGGVSLHHALSFTEDPDATLGDLTRAWGWTGIIHGGWKKEIVAEIKLSAILATLREQLCRAVNGSAERLEGERAAEARRLGERILTRIECFAQDNPDATLAQLYRDLTPFLYETLLGHPPANLATTRTTELLALTPETAALPRFAFVDLFLNPKTRKKAEDAYNLALGGSDIYTLDLFGEGALPFDLVVAGHGRGTLHATSSGIRIDTPVPIVLPGAVTSVKELAERVAQLGAVTLVGKAIALLPMLAAEFVLVFHEGASSYSERTRTLIGELEKQRVPLPALLPILRVKYHTWDAMRAIPGAESMMLHLPEFLAQALDRPTVSAADFAECWPRAILWEKERLAAMRPIASPRALLGYLSERLGGVWNEKCRAHDEGSKAILTLWRDVEVLRERENALRYETAAGKREIERLERAKGDDFRRVQNSSGTLTEADVLRRSKAFDRPIEEIRARIHAAGDEAHALKRERKAWERGPELTGTREALRRLEADAERERARLTRNALQAIYGLPHTAHRPSAWWFPLVDPSGAWLREVARTAEYYLEPLAESR